MMMDMSMNILMKRKDHIEAGRQGLTLFHFHYLSFLVSTTFILYPFHHLADELFYYHQSITFLYYHIAGYLELSVGMQSFTLPWGLKAWGLEGPC